MTHERKPGRYNPYSSQVTSTEPEQFCHVQSREPGRRNWEPVGGTEKTAEGLPELREWLRRTLTAVDWEFRIVRTTVEVVEAWKGSGPPAVWKPLGKKDPPADFSRACPSCGLIDEHAPGCGR